MTDTSKEALTQIDRLRLHVDADGFDAPCLPSLLDEVDALVTERDEARAALEQVRRDAYRAGMERAAGIVRSCAPQIEWDSNQDDRMHESIIERAARHIESALNIEPKTPLEWRVLKMKPTKDRLAAELRAASIKINQTEVAFFEALAKRAETGEFDDYSDVHVCGPTALHSILRASGYHKFAARVAAGEFDASAEESEEWARSQTDPEVVRMMDAMGIGPDRSRDQ